MLEQAIESSILMEVNNKFLGDFWRKVPHFSEKLGNAIVA